jgi:hypothetical protein
LRYICQIGHVLSWQSLMEAQLYRIEAALGTELVVTKERAGLCRQLGQRAETGPPEVRPIVDGRGHVNRKGDVMLQSASQFSRPRRPQHCYTATLTVLNNKRKAPRFPGRCFASLEIPPFGGK